MRGSMVIRLRPCMPMSTPRRLQRIEYLEKKIEVATGALESAEERESMHQSAAELSNSGVQISVDNQWRKQTSRWPLLEKKPRKPR